MAMADHREPQRPSYPPPDDPNQGGYYGQHSPQRPPARDERSPYPPPPSGDPGRQGQYPDPRAAQPYPPPQAWPAQHGAYPPPHHYPDPQHPGYAYPPRPDLGQPPQPMQPDAYRLPPPYPHPAYYPPAHYAPAPAAAPRQRTAIACKYCRKRKIRCSGYDSSPDGRCQNCVRFNQQCLFHPVSSQAAFVPASAVYGPGAARAPAAGDDRANGQQPMLYGAHGQPLGPAGPHGQPPYHYPPPQGYPPPGYPPYQGMPPYTPTGANHYDAQGQGPAGQQDDRKRASPPSGLTPQSGQSFNSPHHGPSHDDGRTPPPNQPNSAASSANGRSGMKVHEMLGGAPPEQRGRSDNEMLSKLDGKK